jgi:hypothetical protein
MYSHCMTQNQRSEQLSFLQSREDLGYQVTTWSKDLSSEMDWLALVIIHLGTLRERPSFAILYEGFSSTQEQV